MENGSYAFDDEADGEVDGAVSHGEPGRAAVLKVLAAYWTGLLALYLVRAIDELWTHRLASLERRVPEVLLGAALCWLMTLALRRADPGTTSARVVWLLVFSLPLGAVFAATNAVAFAMQSGWRVAPNTQLTIDYSVNFAVVFFAWGALYLGMRAAAQLVAAEQSAGAARDAARLAELRALRYQVDPHFLFNCLNSLGTLVDGGDTAAARGMIGEMGSFLRYGLAIDASADVDLGDEIEMQRRYLEIERRRFSHRLAIEVDIDPGLENARIPSLLLQPLVENAVKHGVASTSAPVRLAIRATAAGENRMTVSVDDDAPMAKPRGSRRPGIGIRNVRERLKARFGEAASLMARPSPGGGYRAQIDMPVVRG